jgi:hypothetical protein
LSVSSSSKLLSICSDSEGQSISAFEWLSIFTPATWDGMLVLKQICYWTVMP